MKSAYETVTQYASVLYGYPQILYRFHAEPNYND